MNKNIHYAKLNMAANFESSVFLATYLMPIHEL